MILSETGMAQASMGGGVAEPDPMVQKMMIQMAAKFSWRYSTCVSAYTVMCALPQTMVNQISCFLVFLCALLPGSVTMQLWSK